MAGYEKFHANWQGLPARTTPVTPDALDHIEQGIADAVEKAEQALARPSGGEVDPVALQQAVVAKVNEVAVPKQTVTAQSVILATAGGGTTSRQDRVSLTPYWGADHRHAEAVNGRLHLNDFQNQAGTISVDDLLDAARAQIATDTYKRQLLLPWDVPPTFTRRQVINPGQGFRLGPAGGAVANMIHDSGFPHPNTVNLRTNGSWLYADAAGQDPYNQVRGVDISGLGVKGGDPVADPKSVFIETADNGTTLFRAHFRDMSFAQLWGVMGTGSQPTSRPLRTTAMVCDGTFEINNCFDTALRLAGTDGSWNGELLIDSAPQFWPQTFEGAHIWLDYYEMSTMPTVYVTCQGNWHALHVTGPTPGSGGNQAAPVWFARGSRFMGKSEAEPSNRWLIWQVNGGVDLSGSVIEFGAFEAGASQSVVLQGGDLIMERVWHDRATQVGGTGSQDFPFVTATGPNARLSIRNVHTLSKGGAWSLPPVVKRENGATVTATDGTYRVVDA